MVLAGEYHWENQYAKCAYRGSTGNMEIAQIGLIMLEKSTGCMICGDGAGSLGCGKTHQRKPVQALLDESYTWECGDIAGRLFQDISPGKAHEQFFHLVLDLSVW